MADSRTAMTIVGKKPPCKDCPERTVGCHAKCEKYIVWKEKDSQIKEANRGVSRAMKDIIDYKLIMKNRRRKRRR